MRLARELAALPHLALVCGRYEGIDERVRTLVDREVSIGDYVLTGGELPALVLIDAVVRLVPGVIAEASHAGDSFASGLLEYPQYTRPEIVPGPARCRRSFCRATTARSSDGGGARRCAGRSSDARTCSSRPTVDRRRSARPRGARPGDSGRLSQASLPRVRAARCYTPARRGRLRGRVRMSHR